MTFGFKSFGGFTKSFTLFGKGDHDDDGRFDNDSWGSHDHARLFDGRGECDNDHDRTHAEPHDHEAEAGQGADDSNCADSTSGTAQGTGWPEIPANTAGITFHVDYDGDGTMDNYIPIGRANDTRSFEDYLAQARDQIATDAPDADPKNVIVKATITTYSGDETHYEFTGLEEDSDTPAPVDEADDDSDGDDDRAHGHHAGHHGGHDHGAENGRDDDHEGDNASHDSHEEDGSRDHHADYFQSLMGGSMSFDHGHDDDRWADEDDHDDDHDDFDFC